MANINIIIGEIVRKGNLVEIAQKYGISLRKTGNSFKAKCPFHMEKTPSFFINPIKNVFHCFGCNKSGNIISFVAEIEKVPVKEAIKKLSVELGIKIPYEVDEKLIKSSDLLLEFAKFLNNILKEKENKEAYDYLTHRGVSKEFIDFYLLGYAPKDYRFYDRFLDKKDTLINLGIFGIDSNAVYPILKERIIFPIYDFLGRVVAFGGRNLHDKSDSPKYLNTRENKWFEKRSILYGHPHYTNDLSKWGSAIVVEGYFDQILLNQYGFSNTVGVLGSTFSFNHLNFLEKYVKKVYFFFDEDNAGKKSALASFETVLNANFESFFVDSQTGLDPSDLVVKYGREKLQSIIDTAKPLFEFYCETVKERIKETNNIDEKAHYIDEGIKKISMINNQVKRELYLSQFSDIIGINMKVLEERLDSIMQTKSREYNIYYTLKADNTNNRALLELEAELLFIISKDCALRKEVKNLKIKDYIITPFYRNLYEKIEESEESINEWLNLVNNEEESTTYLSHLYKFEYMDTYEISLSRLLNVVTNLKTIVTNNQLEKSQDEQLEEVIKLKKEILELSD